MSKEIILTIWVLSFALCALAANEMGVVFWLSFVTFVLCSLYIERNKKRLEKE